MNQFTKTFILFRLNHDAYLLMFSKGLRMFSFGFLAVMLVIYLDQLGFSSTRIGLMFTLTLIGDAIISLFLTSRADSLGRRRSLIIGSILSTATSFVFAFFSNYWLLLVAAIFGVISPSGNEIGPFMPIELSSISQVTEDKDRTQLMAWYNLVSCFSSASGALTCGFLLQYLSGPQGGHSLLYSCRLVLYLYTILHGAHTLIFFFLSPKVEVSPKVPTISIPSISSPVPSTSASLNLDPESQLTSDTLPLSSSTPSHPLLIPVDKHVEGNKIEYVDPNNTNKNLLDDDQMNRKHLEERSQKEDQEDDDDDGYGSSFLGLRKSKWVVFHLSGLFMMDAFAGSFILQSLICGWFYRVYGTPTSTLGLMIFVCNLVAGVSALFAASLADRIGLILTMVVTHLPSNILTILIPLMPTEGVAIAVLCLRYSISQMDVPTRNAYVQGVVDPEERSAANGVTNIVRSIGASTGPVFAGMLYQNPQTINVPFYIAGGLKIIYDLLILHSFSQLKTKHEREKDKVPQSIDPASSPLHEKDPLLEKLIEE